MTPNPREPSTRMKVRPSKEFNENGNGNGPSSPPSRPQSPTENLKKGAQYHQCPQCPHRSRVKSNLTAHINSMHSNNRPHACPVCPYRAKIKSNLTQHIKIHDREKEHPCTQCDYMATHAARLKRHVFLKHTPQGEKKTPKQFYEYERAHSNLWDISANGNDGLMANGKGYQCEICDYTCTHKGTLTIHMKSKHTVDKPFKCSRCNFETLYSYFLTQHLEHCRPAGGSGNVSLNKSTEGKK